MTLPNADAASIDSAKVRDYLLSTTHPVGRFKADFFAALGYTAEGWEKLRDDLLMIGRTGAAAPGRASGHGTKYEVDGILSGPNGRSAQVKTVWIVRPTDTAARFVTALPR